jgi:hypothetical protein
MIREKPMEKGVGDPHTFRWRSHEIMRIEAVPLCPCAVLEAD